MARAWRMAPALEVLRHQINDRWPGRSLAADGGIGNEEHAARKSDHNPNRDGVVTARDFTHDLRVGLDSKAVAHAIGDTKDKRIDYLISFDRIMYGPLGSDGKGKGAWQWVDYNGPSPHDHHFHISVRNEGTMYNDETKWDLSKVKVEEEKAKLPVDPLEAPTLVKGTKGNAVKAIQVALNKKGANLNTDGDFGERTRQAVIAFQKLKGLIPDGAVGPATRAKLFT